MHKYAVSVFSFRQCTAFLSSSCSRDDHFCFLSRSLSQFRFLRRWAIYIWCPFTFMEKRDRIILRKVCQTYIGEWLLPQNDNCPREKDDNLFACFHEINDLCRDIRESTQKRFDIILHWNLDNFTHQDNRRDDSCAWVGLYPCLWARYILILQAWDHCPIMDEWAVQSLNAVIVQWSLASFYV